MESMDIHGNLWNPWIPMESMDIHGFHGYPLISMDIRGCPWMSIDIHGMRGYIHGLHGYPWISMDVHGIHGHPWNPWISTDSMDIHGFHGYPWIPWKQVFHKDLDWTVSKFPYGNGLHDFWWEIWPQASMRAWTVSLSSSLHLFSSKSWLRWKLWKLKISLQSELLMDFGSIPIGFDRFPIRMGWN